MSESDKTNAPKPFKPKQIAGKSLTRPVPKQVAGAGMTRQATVPKKTYGKRYKVLWKEKLLKPDIEIVKIMKDGGYSVELIDSEGNYRKTVHKTDFFPLALIDDNDKEIPLVDLAPTPLDELYNREGMNFKVLWKEDLMKPRVEVVTIVEETNYNCELVDSQGQRKKGVTKTDLIILECLGPGKAANKPEEQEFPVGTTVKILRASWHCEGKTGVVDEKPEGQEKEARVYVKIEKDEQLFHVWVEAGDLEIVKSERDVCEVCYGNGCDPENLSDLCPGCGGFGRDLSKPHPEYDPEYPDTNECEDCDGNGVMDEKMCETCGGEGSIDVDMAFPYGIKIVIIDGDYKRRKGKIIAPPKGIDIPPNQRRIKLADGTYIWIGIHALAVDREDSDIDVDGT